MLRRTFRFMSFWFVIGFVCLFIAANAVAQPIGRCDATSDALRIQKGECFYNNGWVVEVIPVNGNFPDFQNIGTPENPVFQSVFAYQVTNLTGKSMSKADILVPICQPVNFNDPANLKIISNSPSGTLYGPPNFPIGFGDPNTGFGLGLTTVNTWVWNGATGILSITLEGKVLASSNAMLLNRGTANYAYGQILAPCCGIIGNQYFPPVVPLTTMTEMTIEGINVCVESADESGCPTKIYSCSDQNFPVCQCPAGNDANGNPYQQLWTKGTIRDFGVIKGKLRQTWIENNPRCPMTFLSLEGSCSQAGLTNNNYAYLSGQYSSIEGTVYGPGGVKLAGAYMKMCTNGVPPCNDYTFYTDANGKYKICIPAKILYPNYCQPASWKGTVTVKVPLPLGQTYTFTPRDYTVGGVCGTITNQDFIGQ